LPLLLYLLSVYFNEIRKTFEKEKREMGGSGRGEGEINPVYYCRLVNI